MNKTLKQIPVIIAICALLSVPSCKKDLALSMNYEAYTFSGLDSAGGTWKPILLVNGNQFSVSAPAATNSSAYLQELQNLKSTVNNISSEQKKAVEFWSTNSLIRWNEIANNLSAKYNLPPAPNSDGSYTAPDAANPSAYPNFPFSHPPYSCRMFAYWGGAQLDALISVWNQKYAYHRDAPYKNDASINPVLPKNDLPSYPSEDAAIAAVSEVILTAMFPLEKDYIKQKSDELKNTRLWAGTNVASDIAAGDSIGRSVAAVFITRSKTDGMKLANVSVAVADSIENVAQATWGWHWENLETPQRRVGILPRFGNVTPWFIPSVQAVRPGPPPAPGSTEFNTAVDELKGFEKHLTQEQRDIALFWNDGPSTYTPPGHWNQIAYDHIIKSRLNPLRTARIFAYMNMAIEDAGISCWDTKYYYHYPRPSGTSSVKVLIPIPNFPSYTSGHSTFSGAAAEVLSYFFPQSSADFQRQAQEAADSRVYARIHYRFDAETGLTVGKNIANYAVSKAVMDGAD
jgi:hypothetical protein